MFKFREKKVDNNQEVVLSLTLLNPDNNRTTTQCYIRVGVRFAVLCRFVQSMTKPPHIALIIAHRSRHNGNKTTTLWVYHCFSRGCGFVTIVISLWFYEMQMYAQKTLKLKVKFQKKQSVIYYPSVKKEFVLKQWFRHCTVDLVT